MLINKDKKVVIGVGIVGVVGVVGVVEIFKCYYNKKDK